MISDKSSCQNKPSQRREFALLLALISASLSPAVSAQTNSTQQSIGTMAAIFQKYQGKTICSPNMTVKDGADALNKYSAVHPEKGGQLTNKDMYDALVEEFPCPFNPKRVAARPGNADDLIGFWQLAPESQQLTPKI